MGETPQLLQHRSTREPRTSSKTNPPTESSPSSNKQSVENADSCRCCPFPFFSHPFIQDAEGFESPGSAHSTPSTVDSPSPSDNLSLHPYFRKEFALPYDEALDSIISSRRVRDSTSPTSSSSSPSPPPPPPTKGRRGARRGGRGAGGGGGPARPPASHVTAESDSSALTMESGDESVAPTPKGSANSGSDAGTDYGEDEDVEVTASPGTWLLYLLAFFVLSLFPSAPPSAKPVRGGRGRGWRGRAARARGRGADSTRGVKKRKR